MTVATLDQDWRQRAACRDADDPDAWFSTAYYTQAAAKQICQRCPTVADCLADALAAEDTWAIRGGLTPAERKQHRKQDKAEKEGDRE